MPLQDCREPGVKPAWGESNAKVPQGTIAKYLRALCKTYGSCAVLAVEDDLVVGTLRFYPSALDDLLQDIQQEESVKAIAAFKLADLPPKESLSPKTLQIHCFQVAEVGDAVRSGQESKYLRRGIGTNMLKALIDWARSEGWDEIRAKAIQHIRPLMSWINYLSVERYRALGFEIGKSVSNDELLGGVRGMRAGHHGEIIEKLWGPYAHLSDEEAATKHDVVLDLRKDRRPDVIEVQQHGDSSI